MTDFPSIAAGEEVFPEMQGYKMACCDCGLVHSLNFRVVKVDSTSDDGLHSTSEPDDVESLRVVLTADRDEDATAMIRARDTAAPPVSVSMDDAPPCPVWLAGKDVSIGWAAGWSAGGTHHAYAAAPPAEAPAERDIRALVDRFLGWPLPKTFSPDCGISFDGRKDDEWNKNKTWPVGTNLLTAIEAEAMFRHVLAAAPAGEAVTVENAPIGTLAPSISGGRWCRVEHGWKWNGPDGSGGVFPRPGGDWNGTLIAAPAAPAEGGVSAQTFDEKVADFVMDYEFMGEDEEGREGTYQPNERERALIEDAIRNWDAWNDEPAPRVTGGREAQDAARYTWLRCGGWEVMQDPAMWPEALRFDGAIDAAMALQAATGGEG